MPDLADVIRQDHEIVADLLQRLTAEADSGERPKGAARADLVRRLVTTMSVHAAAEEQVVYPVIAAKVDGGDALAAEARRDHQEMKELLAVIDRGQADDPEVAAALRTLETTVTAHVREEEDDLLVRLRDAVGTPEMQRLRTEFLEHKATAPTHPHPHAPSTPPANLVAGLLAGVVDRARDTVARFSGELDDQDPAVLVNEMIKGERFAMVTSRGRDGSLRSRPLVVQEADFDGDLWFFIGQDSTIHDDVGKKGGHVNVSFGRPDQQRWVSLTGKGHLIDDRAKAEELWSKVNEAWFPGGLDDPNLALLKVEVTEAEVWDSSTNPVSQALGMMTAMVTGKRYNPGRHRQLELVR